MLLEDMRPDFEHEDGRGKLTQLVHEGYQQVNVLKTRMGVLRGGHYHNESKECFYVVSGSVVVHAYEKEDIEKEGVDKSKLGEHCTYVAGNFFMIRPGLVHEMYFPEDCTMIAMYDKPVEKADGSKDIIPA